MSDLKDIPTRTLRAMVDICPDGKDVTKVQLSCNGRTVTLTKESRERGLAELKRRKLEEKGARP